MSDLNQLIITGNLTRDPELRFTPKGTAVCQFGIASNHVWFDGEGKKNEEVFFGDVQAYGKTGEAIAKHFKKGRKILVSGRLKLDAWEDKVSGDKKRATRIMLDSFQFMGEPRTVQNEEADAQAARTTQRAPAASPPRPPADPDLDAAPDDIPF